jgi:hypothetical protein
VSNFPGHPKILTSSRGDSGTAVYINDQITNTLDVPFLQEVSTSTVAVETAHDDRTVTLAAGHGASAGNILEIADGSTGDFIQAVILNVNVNVITIDQPINRIYIVGAPAIISTADMLVDGSVTPQIFKILPLPAQSGDMVRVFIDLRGSSAMDFATFGSDAALTNGCVLRYKLKNGDYRNIFNWKSNGDFIRQAFDHRILVNTGNNERAFVSRTTFGGQDKRGAVIRLEGAESESLEVIIQDNLTAGANTLFQMTAQGHELME